MMLKQLQNVFCEEHSFHGVVPQTYKDVQTHFYSLCLNLFYSDVFLMGVRFYSGYRIYVHVIADVVLWFKTVTTNFQSFH